MPLTEFITKIFIFAKWSSMSFRSFPLLSMITPVANQEIVLNFQRCFRNILVFEIDLIVEIVENYLLTEWRHLSNPKISSEWTSGFSPPSHYSCQCHSPACSSPSPTGNVEAKANLTWVTVLSVRPARHTWSLFYTFMF